MQLAGSPQTKRELSHILAPASVGEPRDARSRIVIYFSVEPSGGWHRHATRHQ